MARMELLAPAGDPASLAAAVESGADAVYFGLKNLSARRETAEFTFREARAAAEYARKKNVKIYPAFNSLVKGRELKETLAGLRFLAELGVDGLIVQDLGVHRVARRHFPEIPLHASTLLAAHSSLGAAALKDMGFSRVVLAREMSLKEIEAATRVEGVGLEVFVHGALCFSVSGLCLASSFFGGMSGLRGRCTQPCRRLYKGGQKELRFLNPGDLSLIAELPKLKKLGVAALKIEGRMKRPDYVAGVVSAYRRVLDAPEEKLPEAIETAREELMVLAGRRLTSGHLLAPEEPPVLIPHLSGASGRAVGRVVSKKEGRARVRVKEPFGVGDVLRPQSKRPGEVPGFKVKDIQFKGSPVREAPRGRDVYIRYRGPMEKGANLFLLSRGKESKKWQDMARRLIKVGPEKGPSPKGPREIYKGCPKKKAPEKESLYIKVGGVDALKEGLALPVDAVYLCAGPAEMNRLLSMKKLLNKNASRIGVGLLPVVFEAGLDQLVRAVSSLGKRGVKRFLVSNVGHLKILGGDKNSLMGDHTLNALNPSTLCAAKELGLKAQVLSLEADRDALADMLKSGRGAQPVVAAYARHPLMVSRFSPFGGKSAELTGPKGERLVVEERYGLTLVFEKRPLCLFGLLDELREMGAGAFMLDLTFTIPGRAGIGGIYQGFRKKRPPRVHSTFNLAGRLY